MKKILCLILCLVMLVSVCACGKNEDDPSASASDAVSQGCWVDPIFAEAEATYAWFTGCGKPAYDHETIRDVEGASYAMVTVPGLDSMEALQERLCRLFSDEIALQLVDSVVYPGTPVFREYNDDLYYCVDMLGQVPYDIGQRTAYIDSQTDTEAVYHLEITHDYYATSFSAFYDYRLVKNDDGSWRFVDFKLPALLIAGQMFGVDHAEEASE